MECGIRMPATIVRYTNETETHCISRSSTWYVYPMMLLVILYDRFWWSNSITRIPYWSGNAGRRSVYHAFYTGLTCQSYLWTQWGSLVWVCAAKSSVPKGAEEENAGGDIPWCGYVGSLQQENVDCWKVLGAISSEPFTGIIKEENSSRFWKKLWIVFANLNNQRTWK